MERSNYIVALVDCCLHRPVVSGACVLMLEAFVVCRCCLFVNVALLLSLLLCVRSRSYSILPVENRTYWLCAHLCRSSWPLPVDRMRSGPTHQFRRPQDSWLGYLPRCFRSHPHRHHPITTTATATAAMAVDRFNCSVPTPALRCRSSSRLQRRTRSRGPPLTPVLPVLPPRQLPAACCPRYRTVAVRATRCAAVIQPPALRTSTALPRVIGTRCSAARTLTWAGGQAALSVATFATPNVMLAGWLVPLTPLWRKRKLCAAE
jgi:hypothetical protein